MKKIMSIAAVALFMAGSSAFACDTCGCKAKADEGKKAACCGKAEDKACCAKKDAKKCAEGCTKKCCAPKAEK